MLATALATSGLLAVSALGGTTVATADPAATPAATTITATGVFSTVTVPDGVCAVQVVALGGGGGSATAANAWNGGGAQITAVYPVHPGQSFSGTVGAGGVGGVTAVPGTGGAPGPGGTGGTGTQHLGAGGGGYTVVQLDGTDLIVAGAGGGASGGHATTGGRGGDAGLPSASGVTAGSTGQSGFDNNNSSPWPGGGAGGGTGGAGLGGTNTNDSARNGFAGSGRAGGNGGADTNADSGGGGGAGYYGAGGGASTVAQGATPNATAGNTGGGGGGGASYVAPTVTDGALTSVSSAIGPKLTGAGNGANGSVTLNWITCAYDLAVTKSVSNASPVVGSTVTWTVTVANTGAAMTRGDVVTLTDSLPGAGAKTITSIQTSGGANTLLASAPVTCSAAVGATMPSSLTCSRPYQPTSGSVSGTRGLNAGETLTIAYTQVVTESAGTTLTNTASVTDRAGGTNNSATAALTTVAPVPVDANDDSSLGNAQGSTVSVAAIGNDTGGALASSMVFVGNGATSLTVTGQGIWSIDTTTGAIAFAPQSGFTGNPTPVQYRVSNALPSSDTATVTVTYLPTAANDSSTGNTAGSAVNVNVLANDSANVAPGSLRFTANGGSSLSVPGQGTWTVQSGGVIRFVPQTGFTGNPTPVSYTVDDGAGHTAAATLTVTYTPSAANDSSLNNAQGATVTVPALANDSQNVLPGSVRLTANGGTSLTVPGQGIWTVNTTTGAIAFAPESGYTGNPTPVGYTANDGLGNGVAATVTVTYAPSAANDASLNNAQGATVTVPALANDSQNVLPGSVRLTANGGTSLTVPGQGIWTVNTTTGAITFAPESGYTGNPTPVGYTANDGLGNGVAATVTVTYVVSAANDSSLNNGQTVTATVPVLANDSQNLLPTSVVFVANSSKSYTVVGEGTWSIDPASGVVSFAPISTFTGNPTPVGYTANDGLGHSASATATVTYLPAAANDAALDNAAGSTVTMPVLDNDTDNVLPGSVRLAANGGTILTVPGQGVWTVNTTTGAITFAPESGYTGNPTPVGYTANDGLGNGVSATVTVTYGVAALDDSDLDNAQGSTVTVDVLDNDSDNLVATSVVFTANGTKSLTVTGQGTWTISATTGAVTFAPATGYTGNPTPVEYSANDGLGHTVTADVTVTYAPSAADDEDLDNAQGSVVNIDVLDNDSDNLIATSVVFTANGTKSLTVTGQGTWLINPTTGIVRFTPASGFTGNPTPVEYSANDGLGHTVTADITITYVVTADDDASLGNAQGATVAVAVLDNDSDNLLPTSVVFAANGAKSFTVPGQGVWTISPTTGVISFAPESGYTGNPTPVEYTADDGLGHSATAELTVTYVASAADDSDLDNAQGSTVTVDVLDNDSDNLVATSVVFTANGTKSLTVTGQGTWTISATTGAVTFAPATGYTGNPTPVEYSANDGLGHTVTADVTVTYVVTAAADSDLGNAIGATVTVPVLDNDSDNLLPGTVVFTANGTTSLTVTGEGVWTIDPTTGAVTFAPESGFSGNPAPVSYTAGDGLGHTATATVTVTYGPVATDDTVSGSTRGTSVTVDVLDNDSDNLVPGSVRFTANGGTTLVVTGQGTWTISATTGAVTFAPEAGFTGNPTPVEYSANDGLGHTVTADVTITYAPFAVDDSVTGVQLGQPATVPVLGNDSANLVPGSVLFTASGTTTLTVTGEGVWTVVAGGGIRFTPETGFEGNPTPVEYSANDGLGTTVTADVAVAYTPTAGDDESLDNALGATVTVDVLANDHGALDPASVRFTATGTTTLVVVGQGTWTVDPLTGAISFAPVAGFVGNPDPVRYAVDANGTTVEADVLVTYLPIADDDVSSGNAPGTAVTVNPLGNDTGNFDVTSLRLIDPATGARVTSLTVAGQGTWVVNADGTVTFTPVAGFTGDPTPVTYEVRNLAGVTISAQISIRYLAAAAVPPGSGLAHTGTLAAPSLLLSLALIAGGLAVLLLRRRRQVAAAS